MLADHCTTDVARARDMGGLSACMYFLTVSLCMRSSRAIPRMDSPLRFAFCTAFHLAVCSGVGFLDRGVTVLRTLAAPLRSASSRSLSTSSIVPIDATSSSDLLMTPLVWRLGTVVCTVLVSKLRRIPGRGGASWEATIRPSCCTASRPSRGCVNSGVNVIRRRPSLP